MDRDLENIASFQHKVREYYRLHGRHDLPWRQPEEDGRFDPYKILVSEIMLQQTQVVRVIPKFREFLRAFPSFQALHDASLGSVLTVWSGLGYNRRAKFLWQAARAIVQDHRGVLPADKRQLVELPGIGANTAGAILTYALNQRQIFLETNVRTVLIHHFFADQTDIADAQLAELARQTLPVNGYREWYWALMDYGTHLKQTIGNASRRSKSFTKQSTFAGSRRQVRGAVLKMLSISGCTKAQLVKQITDSRLDSVLDDLSREGLILFRNDSFTLP